MLVEHPRSVVIIAMQGDAITVVRQPRPGSGGPTVELPAGCLEPGEDALSCAKRELSEECSLGAARWRSIGSFWAAPAYSTEYVEVFEASELFGVRGQPDPDEQLTSGTLPISELPGGLSDATSIAAFGLWLACRDGPSR